MGAVTSSVLLAERGSELGTTNLGAHPGFNGVVSRLYRPCQTSCEGVDKQHLKWMQGLKVGPGVGLTGPEAQCVCVCVIGGQMVPSQSILSLSLLYTSPME